LKSFDDFDSEMSRVGVFFFCVGGCSKKLLDQDEVSKVAQADSERGFTPEDVKLMKIQFSSCVPQTHFPLFFPPSLIDH
jgi:hypothetical protein